MKLVAYIRVSTKVQAETGEGLAIQRDAIRAWAKANGHRVVTWCADEGVSGTTEAMDRDGLLCAVGELQAGNADGIVVWRLDRLARDVIVQESFLRDLRRSGKRLFSTTPTEQAFLDDDEADPSRKMVRTILGAVSTYEKEMAVLRMKAGRRAKAAKGGFAAFGRPHYGTRSEHAELVEEPDERAAVDRVVELHGEGRSLREIIATITAEGHKPRHAANWYPTQINRIIRRNAPVPAL